MNAPTQAAPYQTTRLNIDFTHRLGWAIHDNNLSAHALNICVNDMADRAEGTLIMLESNFIGLEDGLLPDGTIYNVLQSVLNEIKDIRSIVNAFGSADFSERLNNQP